jgi:ADP-heptose:LPS heptosyltransferase
MNSAGLTPADLLASSAKRHLAAPSYRRPFVFFSDGIGDHLMALPALRALTMLFEGRLGVFCRPEVATTVFAELSLAHIISDNFSGEGRLPLIPVARLSSAVRECDLFLSLNSWRSQTVGTIMRSFRHQWTVGFDAGFSTCLPNILAEHVIDRAFRVPQAFDPKLRVEDFAGPPKASEADLGQARAAIKDAFTTQAPFLLVIHPETMPEKRIPCSSWLCALDLFLQRKRNWNIVILSRDRYASDVGDINSNLATRWGLPLGAALALVGVANLFAGVDSSLLHAADLYRVPGLGLFGPSDPRRWGFRFGPHHHFVVREHDWPAIDVRKLADILCRMATNVEMKASP